MTRSAWRLKALVLFATGCLAAAVAPVPAGAAPLGTADRIVFTSITTPGVTVPSAPGAPAIYVTADEDFTVTADFRDDAGANKPASIFFPVNVELYADSADGSRTLLASQVAPANATSVSFSGLRLPAQNGVSLHMQASNGIDVLFPGIEGDSPSFDVEQQTTSYPPDSNPSPIGGSGPQTANTACTVSLAEPICGDLVLNKPNGVLSNQLASVGNCFADECRTDEYLQAIVKLDPNVYNRSFPMRIVVKCHPSVCDEIVGDDHSKTKGGGHNGGSPGGGHGGGIKLIKLVASTSPDGLLAPSPACTSSGKVAASQPFCTDYGASFRASNGVWHLVWLSPGDARVSLPK